MHALKTYLVKSKRLRADLAAKVNTSPLYLTHIMAGRKFPGDELTEALIRETGLSYEDFHPKRAAMLKRVGAL